MEHVLSNAEVVTADRVFRGSVLVRNGHIADVSEGTSRVGEDCNGQYLAPGLVDLHTDNLEKHFFPRPNIDWDPVSAAIIHDGFCLSLGVTTVFDALSVGSYAKKESRKADNLVALSKGIEKARVISALKGCHYLHWRCELTSDDLLPMLETLIGHPMTAMLSLMDHTPGQRQYRNLSRFLDLWRSEGSSEQDIEERLASARSRQEKNTPRNRRAVAALALEHKLPVLAHDDETAAQVDVAWEAGAGAAEFPVTEEAALRSRARGMPIIMGGPNLIRGGSYSGNIGVSELARLDLLDAIASDYVPRSMIESPFVLASDRFGWSLPKAMATVTSAPARIAGLADRGEVAAGLRADLIRIRLAEGRPVVTGVWVEGSRVA